VKATREIEEDELRTSTGERLQELDVPPIR